MWQQQLIGNVLCSNMRIPVKSNRMFATVELDWNLTA